MNKRIIISTTSYPGRIRAVPIMLQSIYSQTLQPDLVVLYLSLEQFPNEMADIPSDLKALVSAEKLEIRFREGNLKSHKKYLYAFKEFPNDLIVTVDDDLIYPTDMISTLYESWVVYPRATHASRTHLMILDDREVLPYYEWLMEVDADFRTPQFHVYATTGAGTLYDPSLFKEYLYDEEAISRLCLHTDDMWIKANELISGIPVITARRYTPLRYISGTQTADCLCRVNTPDIQKEQWKNISDWFDAKTGQKNILYSIIVKPAIGYSMTDLNQYLNYYRRQRSNDLNVIAGLKAELECVTGSTCWKITGPLRSLLDAIKQLIGSNESDAEIEKM